MERRESPPLVLLSQSSEDNARSTDAPITICQPVVIETEEAVSYWMDWKRIDRHKQAMLSSDPPRAGTSPRVSTQASPPPANLADVHRVFSELLPSGDAHELKKMIALGELCVNTRIGQGESESNTLLHWTALYGHENQARMLLQMQADKHITDRCGRTALDVAREHNNSTVSELISSWQPSDDLNPSTPSTPSTPNTSRRQRRGSRGVVKAEPSRAPEAVNAVREDQSMAAEESARRWLLARSAVSDAVIAGIFESLREVGIAPGEWRAELEAIDKDGTLLKLIKAVNRRIELRSEPVTSTNIII